MTFSKSPLTGKEYKLPEVNSIDAGLQEFIIQNSAKKIVVVQGLGFVGAVMSLVCSNAVNGDYAVIGVDIADENNYWKIASLNEGVFPLVADDPNIEELFEKSQNAGNFFATFDPIAYAHADTIIIDINLDVQKSSNSNHSLAGFDVKLDGFRAAMRQIGKYCKEDALILVETTVPPGTCEQIVKPEIQGCMKSRGLNFDKLKIGHSYERVMPGPDYVDSIRAFPRVFAGTDDASALATQKFLETIIDTSRCTLTQLEHTNATELAKVLENSYRAMNIAFAVEWSRFAEEAEVDLYGIVEAIRVRPTHANLMFPGIGVGGYCLTKDPLLASWSRENHFGSSALPLSVSGVSINDQMPRFAFERLEQVYGSIKDKHICFLGVSYRGDVGDTRFSPVEPFVKLAQEQNAIITLHDPFVSHWDETNMDVESDLRAAISAAPDIIVISTGHTQYKQKECTELLLSTRAELIYDTIGLLSEDQLNSLKPNHRISVLGRGNI